MPSHGRTPFLGLFLFFSCRCWREGCYAVGILGGIEFEDANWTMSCICSRRGYACAWLCCVLLQCMNVYVGGRDSVSNPTLSYTGMQPVKQTGTCCSFRVESRVLHSCFGCGGHVRMFVRTIRYVCTMSRTRKRKETWRSCRTWRLTRFFLLRTRGPANGVV